MSDETRSLFEGFLDAMMAGRYDEVRELLDPDAVWHVPPFANLPPLRGREAVLDFLEKAAAAFYAPGSMRLEHELVLVDEPNAACIATLRATTKHGTPYENRYAFFARTEAGRLLEVWELMDSLKFQAQTLAPQEPTA